MKTMDGLYRISFNRIPLIEKPDKDFPWSEYMDGFEAEDVLPGEFLWKIGHGFGFAPVFGGTGYPKMDNWLEAQFIAIDIDDEVTTLEELKQHDLVGYHGAIIYPTHSHTDEKPRHRVVFLLDQPVANSQTYNLLCRAFVNMFTGADHAINANKTWMANGKIDADGLWDKCYLPERFVLTPEQVITYVMGSQRQQSAKKNRLERMRQVMAHSRPPTIR